MSFTNRRECIRDALHLTYYKTVRPSTTTPSSPPSLLLKISSQSKKNKRRRGSKSDDDLSRADIAKLIQAYLESLQLPPKQPRQFPTIPPLKSLKGLEQWDYGVRGALDRYNLMRYIDGDIPAPGGRKDTIEHQLCLRDREDVCSFLISTIDLAHCQSLRNFLKRALEILPAGEYGEMDGEILEVWNAIEKCGLFPQDPALFNEYANMPKAELDKLASEGRLVITKKNGDLDVVNP
ncbi:hypothetical protein B0H63DRAFT_450529 [Podospora didyma]|uniref:Uncharacterized protein n=1 Tax=Podospora didyma TaxID=330526 RepID=A0AAE0NGT5_9PEZI|nr:hypothetical protein B0H63DRAFT_450529 [Podospora didyma]